MAENVKPVPRWLVFFYSVPSRPVKNRVSVWRRLMKIGALQIKGAVYVLPYSEGHVESLQWLVSEVASMGGEGAFLGTDGVEPMSDEDIIALFNESRARQFNKVERELSVLERKLDAMRKGGRAKDLKALSARHLKLNGNLEGLYRIDYFGSPAGKAVREKSERIKTKLALVDSDETGRRQSPVMRHRARDYQGRTWATRHGPFVDRMATAWLVRRFIDPGARFEFVDDREPSEARHYRVLFDIQGGEFTHVGDLCTFEAVVRGFGIRDRAVRRMAETVHELDIKDGRYQTPEARGIEDILSGIRKASRDDLEALKRGMDVFEMLYLSLK